MCIWGIQLCVCSVELNECRVLIRLSLSYTNTDVDFYYLNSSCGFPNRCFFASLMSRCRRLGPNRISYLVDMRPLTAIFVVSTVLTRCRRVESTLSIWQCTTNCARASSPIDQAEIRIWHKYVSISSSARVPDRAVISKSSTNPVKTV